MKTEGGGRRVERGKGVGQQEVQGLNSGLGLWSAPRYLMSEGEKESAVQTYRRDKDYTLYYVESMARWTPNVKDS
jgi:hypothetical protein